MPKPLFQFADYGFIWQRKVMSIAKTLDAITEEDLVALIRAQVPEGKTVEYKRELSIGDDQQKRKFLASLASFANAAGGDLIFGMLAEKGVPTEVTPLTGFEPDRDTRTLRDLARAHIEPSLSGVEYKAISIKGGHVLIIRVPQAWGGAHMVTYNNDFRFYARDTNGKVPMNLGEIRGSFSILENLRDRLRRWKDTRLDIISRRDLPVSLMPGPKMVAHLLPLRAFEAGYSPDLAPVLKNNNLQPIVVRTGFGIVHDLEGVFSADRLSSGVCSGYSAVMRNGCVEIVETVGKDSILWNPQMEQWTVDAFNAGKKKLSSLGIPLPFAVVVSYLEVEGYCLELGNRMFMQVRPIRQRSLMFHEQLVETVDAGDSSMLKPFCDGIWQACGIMRSFNFDEAGDWNPQKY